MKKVRLKNLPAIHRELRARGIEAQRQLLALLDDPDLGTRCWAAMAVMEFAPTEGARVLACRTRKKRGGAGWLFGGMGTGGVEGRDFEATLMFPGVVAARDLGAGPGVVHFGLHRLLAVPAASGPPLRERGLR